MKNIPVCFYCLIILFIFGCDISYTEPSSQPVSKAAGNWSLCIGLDSTDYFVKILSDAILLDDSIRLDYCLENMREDSLRFYWLMMTIEENNKIVSGKGILAYHLDGDFNRIPVEVSGTFNKPELNLNLSCGSSYKGTMDTTGRSIDGYINIESREYFLRLIKGKRFW